MAIAVVSNTIKLSANDNSVTTDAIDTSGADFIAIVLTTFSGSAGTLSDSKGNTWTPRTYYGSAGDARVRIYYCASAVVGSGHTFSFTETAKFPALSVIALSGVHATPYDVENGNATSVGGTTRQPGSVTPSEDNEILITGYSGYSSALSSINSGFTLLDSGTYNTHAMTTGLAYKIQTTAGAENPTWTSVGSNSCAAAIATFKSAGAATGQPAMRRFGGVDNANFRCGSEGVRMFLVQPRPGGLLIPDRSLVLPQPEMSL